MYGYNTYMSSNKEGLVLTVGITSANESEMTYFPTKALPRNLSYKTRVLYDKGADSNKNRKEVKKRDLREG